MSHITIGIGVWWRKENAGMRLMMQIDRKRVMDAFAKYTNHYDVTDEKIKLKIDHTYRVAGLCDRIARSIGLSESDIDLAWLTGMLHDVGRFEQLRQFGTFSDAESIDHAHFAVEILFDDNKIVDYVDVDLELARKCGKLFASERGTYVDKKDMKESDRQDELVERNSTSKEMSTIHQYTDIEIVSIAIWNHSAFRVEKGLDERTKLFCDIIRDADKIDILKVNHDIPLEIIYNVSTPELKNAVVSDGVMQEFFNHQAILRGTKKTPIDNRVGHAALVFELVFQQSYAIVEEQGYLEKILQFQSDNSKTKKQFEKLRKCMQEFLNCV